jgi:hypothetical protein
MDELANESIDDRVKCPGCSSYRTDEDFPLKRNGQRYLSCNQCRFKQKKSYESIKKLQLAEALKKVEAEPNHRLILPSMRLKSSMVAVDKEAEIDDGDDDNESDMKKSLILNEYSIFDLINSLSKRLKETATGYVKILTPSGFKFNSCVNDNTKLNAVDSKKLDRIREGLIVLNLSDRLINDNHAYLEVKLKHRQTGKWIIYDSRKQKSPTKRFVDLDRQIYGNQNEEINPDYDLPDIIKNLKKISRIMNEVGGYLFAKLPDGNIYDSRA